MAYLKQLLCAKCGRRASTVVYSHENWSVGYYCAACGRARLKSEKASEARMRAMQRDGYSQSSPSA